jgi:anti-sigma regulatory factor (Ser/Thr protein kinase)
MKRKEKLQEIFNFTNDEIEFLIEETPRDIATKIFEIGSQLNEKISRINKPLKSPYLKKSTNRMEFKGIVNRDAVVNDEIGQHIDEAQGTMFFFKEKTRELAEIAQLDPDEMRMAFTEGIQNVLEHGEGDNVEISVTVNNLNNDNVYLEMSFKHYMSDKNFYSLKEANKSADTGILDFESPRGRGEFMMREIMDERKFINGYEKDDAGTGHYFFQRILRKYMKSKPKNDVSKLTNDFKQYIDTLQNYGSALFV